MKVAVYAVLDKGVWGVRLSLDLRVDVEWWNKKNAVVASDEHLRNCKMFILSRAIPLGWAVKLRDGFTYRNEMQQWGTDAWGEYVSGILEKEWSEEREARRGQAGMGAMGGMNERNGWTEGEERAERGGREDGSSRSDKLERAKEAERVDREGRAERVDRMHILAGRGVTLEQAADGLAELMSGRSLLEPELMALLSERCPELAEHWRSAAQLAHLRGRLRLEAALSVGPMRPAAAHRGPRQQRSGAGGLARAVAALLPHWRLPWRGAARRRALPRCLRCGSAATARTACAACGLAGCAYCEACLALGRSRSCALLLRSAALPAAVLRSTADLDPTAAARRWGLGAAQAEAAGAALGFMAEPRQRSADPCPERFLLWAVTGAGKTEMIFPLLEAVLFAGGRALVATPRRDVVLELAPRLAKAFPAETIAVLYGGSPDRWTSGRLILATTHQLLRFHQGFDLVIIDELDAFPYHNDPMLAHAAGQACKKDGTFIYLSATPPQELQRQVRKGTLAHARVPVRFHGHPLPQPKHLTMASISVCLKRGGLPKPLIQALRKSLARNAQIFMFVSRIAHIEKLLPLLRRNFPGVVIAGTSSQDPARGKKVNAFRSREISMLVTTTILERGVTVPRSDVFIMDADSNLFDEASLVQMAGRAGRSKEDPAGIVIFASSQWSRSQRGAISQIRTMNRIAQRKGYLRKEQS
ncbi:helicase-related protein [Paenibacillus sp. BR2-3]|uniref:helicase-related protein n=1 Tax=Paenibacillus sp. BR2-3 TaxID=3048494 RepID=UPI0039773D75